MKEYGFVTIDTRNNIELIESDKEEFTLDELYQYSDCDCIQILTTGKESLGVTYGQKLMVIDDEGKLLGKEVNILATLLYEPQFDFIVGKAVLGTSNPFREPDVYKMPIEDAKRLYDGLNELKRHVLK